MEYLLLTLMITILYPGYITTITASSAPPNAVDYCKLQVFQPRCDHNEVILIEHARYGRMRQGTCITRSRELNGCQSDVLSIAHRKCSGRRECDVIVPDVEFEATNPCEDLLSYLEVAYSCVQVATAREESCSTCDVMKVTAPPSGYIASLTTALSRCGGVDCPWLIEAARGQRIQLTLVDFAGRDRAFQQTGICRVYTTIKEPATEKSVTVCGGRAAEQIVYTSLGNAVEIRILALSGDEDTFLLRYQFIGCGEPAIGAGASYTREGDDIHGRCDEFGYTWSLHCNGTAWVGHLPNCSLPYSANNPDGNSAASGAVSEIAAGSALSFSWEMALVLITIVTVGVVACVLIVGIVCIKRTRQPYIPTAAPQGEPIYALYDVTARRPSVKHYMGYNSLPKDFSTLCKLYNTDTMHSCPYNNNTIANRYCGSATMRDMRNHEPPFRTTRRPAGYAPVAPPLIPEVDFHAEIPPGQQYSSLMDNRPLPSPPPPWEGGEATE